MSTNVLFTTCLHGLDLRVHPRCYLCRPDDDPVPVTTEDPEPDGSLDDLFIRGGIESFHIERMDRNIWWFAVYLKDGSRHTFNLHAKGRIDAEHHVELRP